jgi:glycine cleavage system aminomethyltransferase T
VGRTALERIAAKTPERKLCLLDTLAGFHPIAHGEAVSANGELISTVTSGDPGFTLGRTFAFAYLPQAAALSGSEVSIAVKDRPEPVTARVLTRAPYDPQRRQLTV